MKLTGLAAGRLTMDSVRRLAALVIALSLALPQRSCINHGQVEIHYPLSNVDSVISITVIAALYTLPLLLLFASRFRVGSLIAGAATVATGLYYVSYGAAVIGTTLMVGWYTYTLGAVAYLAASLVQLKRLLVPGGMATAAGANACTTGNAGTDCSSGTCHTSDLAGNLRSLLLVWGLPFAAFAGGFILESWGRTALWAGALAVAGGACVANARQCGRTHCYFTGPYFLLCALVVVLAQFGVLVLDESDWHWLGIAIVVGGVLLYFVPEILLGKYSRGTPPAASDNRESVITCPQSGVTLRPETGQQGKIKT